MNNKFEFVFIGITTMAFVMTHIIASTTDWQISNHLDSWLTPLDRCILTKRGDDVLTECRESTYISEEKQPLRCTVGNSWPSRSGFCSSVDLSFDERKNFIRSVIGFDDPSQKPLYHFFNTLGFENGAALFIGDSVMQQFFSAIACELEREGVWTDTTKFTNTGILLEMIYLSSFSLYHVVVN